MNFTNSIVEKSQIPRLVVLFAIKHKAIDFIRTIYWHLPDGVFDRAMSLPLAYWTGKHVTRSLSEVPRTIRSGQFLAIDSFAVVVALFHQNRLKYGASFLDALESTSWKDLDKLCLNRQSYCYSAAHQNLALVKFFFVRNHDVALPTNDNVAFHNAVRWDHRANSELLQFLYECNPDDINRRNSSGHTAVIIAIKYNNTNSLEFLIAKGTTQLHTPDFTGRLPLHFATSYSRREMVKMILNDSKSGLYDTFHAMSPIHIAASYGGLSFLELFLSMEPDLLNYRPNGIGTPINVAIKHGQLETVKYLKLKGAEINPEALSDAVSCEHVAICELLISYGCDVNGCEEELWKPMFRAAEKGNVVIGKMLVEAGAGIDLIEQGLKWTPLHFTAEFGHLEFARLLIESGSTLLNTGNAYNHTPLNIASYNGFDKLVEFFLEKGAQIEIEDVDGDTALTNAVAADSSKANTKVVEILLEHGANMHHVTKSGSNVFHRCCETGTLETLKFLLNRFGSESWNLLMMKDDENQTPYDMCVEKQWEDAKLVLIAHHGLWGIPDHLKFLVNELEKRKSEKNDFYVLNGHRNLELKTYDGIDVCGDRFVDEIEDKIEEFNANGCKVTKISFIGYSLGGLINRYVIGKLYVKGFFNNIKPESFLTIVTPHLGVRKKPGDPLGLIWNNTVGFFTLRTGHQIMVDDDDFAPLISDKEPLPILVAMCDPRGPFYKALKIFNKRLLFANTRNDYTSRFTTSAIESSNKFNKYKTVVPQPEKYPYIVSVDETAKRPGEWNVVQISLATLFTVFSPILVPVLLGYVSIRLMKRRIERLNEYKPSPITVSHDWLRNHFEKHPLVEIDETVQVTTEVSKSEKGEASEGDFPPSLTTIVVPYAPPTELPHLKSKVMTRQWMVETLNSVGWIKCFAGITYTNAHAAIVARAPEEHQPSYHVVEFIIEQFFSDSQENL
ncbi:hypothetical protein HK098_002327 [Nowakowskiella sp. JEL0407]|nr:hypothetical protein HK098_002327 [Nowakowskiella sp. JEL0407]